MHNKGFRYAEQIGAAAAGVRVLDFLADRYRHSTRETWRRRIDAGEVELDGRPTAAWVHLSAGAELAWHRPAWEEPPVPLNFAILARDADVLAVAKPRGLPTVPAGGYLENTLLALVRRHMAEATPVHRLGRGTSGIVLFARTERARRSLSSAWREKRARRFYRALVRGHFSEESRVLSSPIGRVPHPVLGSVHAAHPDGRPAQTRVRMLRGDEKQSLVEIEISTGRPHQIRIHLAASGHPLVGDPLYGLGGRPGPGVRALPGDVGYWLHAHALEYPDPCSGAPVRVECEPPTILR